MFDVSVPGEGRAVRPRRQRAWTLALPGLWVLGVLCWELLNDTETPQLLVAARPSPAPRADAASACCWARPARCSPAYRWATATARAGTSAWAPAAGSSSWSPPAV
ncbi:hypothetical protein NKH77_42575 [Streptomyces sp. M19]